MEQKRILWIAAAVGVFLLVVIGAALILYSPKQDDPLLVSQAMQESTWMNVPAPSVPELPLPPAVNAPPVPLPQTAVEQPAAAPVQTASQPLPTQAGNVTVITDSTRVYSTGVTTIDLNSLKSPPQETAQSAPLQPAVQPLTPPGAVSKPAPPPSAGASSSAAAAKPAAPSPKPVASTTTVAAKKPLPSQYWVQAASYNNKKNADAARDSLTANKIPCDVFTHTDSKGKVFYRVRVGPYSTKSEAEYWQNRIALIDEFSREPSFVTKVQ
jgi:cell division septation protein DedD